MDADATTGLFHRDVRLVSKLAMTVEGRTLPLLSSQRDGTATSEQVFALASDPHHSPTALLRRRRTVSTAMVDHYLVETYEVPVRARLQLRYEHDLTDVLRVKAGAETSPAPVISTPAGWTVDGEGFGIAVEASPAPDTAPDGSLFWELDLPPGSRWEATVTHQPRQDARPVPDQDLGERSRLELRTGTTRWASAVSSAIADRDALRIGVPELGLSYLGAGVPWFMALFGRDTLITAFESAIAGSEVGLDVAESLARYQGRDHDPDTGEQPGRILHELRTGVAEVFGIPAGTPYYGTVDASPLFVTLLGELHRWGADRARLRALLPAARAAVTWCIDHGDVDGDGFVEYVSDTDGLVNQGWKDSGDAMVHADGSQATGPIALAEVQAYLYAALVDLAALEEAIGDPSEATGHRDRAASLREAFTRSFWDPAERIVAMALDGDKRPLAVPSSNMGHVLWGGILDSDRGGHLADRLMQSDLFSGWGIRTLASSATAYSPLSYHRGSVWPHDSALCAGGLARYGRREAASRLGDGLLEAAERFDWRLPELFGGQGADEVPFPVPYPVACSPQAWSASVPLLLLRLALGLEPDVPNGVVRLAPRFPDDVELVVSGIELDAAHLAVRVRGRRADVLEAPEGLEVVVE
jgi:glycogen debranching enzyme